MAKNIFEDPPDISEKNCNIKNRTLIRVFAKIYIQTQAISARSDKVLFSNTIMYYD